MGGSQLLRNRGSNRKRALSESGMDEPMRWTSPRRVSSLTGNSVAVAKKLGPLFAPELVDIRVHNGSTAHDVSPYLTARETGEAILHGLA